MATDRQIAANRRNSQHSTGPRTQAGKDKVRFNSVTHGLTATSILIPREAHEADEFEYVRRQFEAEWQPQSFTQRCLLDDAIGCWWRLQRVLNAEKNVFDCSYRYLGRFVDDFTPRDSTGNRVRCQSKEAILGHAFREHHWDLTHITLYQGRLYRQFLRDLNEIRRLKQHPVHTDSEIEPEPQPEPAPPPMAGPLPEHFHSRPERPPQAAVMPAPPEPFPPALARHNLLDTLNPLVPHPKSRLPAAPQLVWHQAIPRPGADPIETTLPPPMKAAPDP